LHRWADCGSGAGLVREEWEEFVYGQLADLREGTQLGLQIVPRRPRNTRPGSSIGQK
jgi:hypothetical protein